MNLMNQPAKARYVDAMFARIARRYDLLNAIMTFGRHATWRRATVDFAVRPSARLALDVAAGTGDLAVALAQSIPRPTVVAVDFCASMLEVAAQKVDSLPPDVRVCLVAGDALHLPLPDATFDCATMGFGLRNVSDVPRALAEIRRVLRPGGRFANLELTPLPGGLRAAVFRAYFNRFVPLLGAAVAGDLAAYQYLPRSLQGFPTAEQLAGLMRDAGFGTVSYRRLAGGTVAIHHGIKP